ncbi:twin-arginine translocation signal domain-containing protein [Symmachiella dynata]
MTSPATLATSSRRDFLTLLGIAAFAAAIARASVPR